MYYVYRFLDKTKKILYVGKTHHLEKRMKEHFSKQGHLMQDQYKQVEKIEYVELDFQLDMDILEKYLINLWKPQFNNTDSNSEITLFKFDINLLKWKNFNKKILNSYNNHSCPKINFIKKNNKLSNSCTQLNKTNKLEFSYNLINILLQANLTLNEHKFLNMIISQINENNLGISYIKLSTNQIKESCQFHQRNLKRNIINIGEKLCNKNYWVIKEEKTSRNFSWLETFNHKDGVYIIKLTEDFKSFFLLKKRNHIKKQISDIQIYKNEYALKLDMFFSMCFYKKLITNKIDKNIKFNFSLENFKLIFGLDDKYKEFRNLNYRVISPALKNINEIKLYKVNLLKTYNSEGKVESITFDVTLGENNDYYKQIQQMIEDREKTEKKKAKVSSVLIMIGYKQKDVDYILKKNNLEEIISQLKALNDKEILEKEDQMEYLGSHLKKKIEKKNKETTIFAMIEEIDN